MKLLLLALVLSSLTGWCAAGYYRNRYEKSRKSSAIVAKFLLSCAVKGAKQ